MSGIGQASSPAVWDAREEAAAKMAGAPTKSTLTQMLADRRMKLLSELRDVEQALEAMEHTPNFEPTMERVLKILHRSF